MALGHQPRLLQLAVIDVHRMLRHVEHFANFLGRRALGLLRDDRIDLLVTEGRPTASATCSLGPSGVYAMLLQEVADVAAAASPLPANGIERNARFPVGLHGVDVAIGDKRML